MHSLLFSKIYLNVYATGSRLGAAANVVTPHTLGLFLPRHKIGTKDCQGVNTVSHQAQIEKVCSNLMANGRGA